MSLKISSRKPIQRVLDPNVTEILYPLLLQFFSCIRKIHIFWKVFDNTQKNTLDTGKEFVYMKSYVKKKMVLNFVRTVETQHIIILPTYREILFCITISSPKISHIQYTRMPSPI